MVKKKKRYEILVRYIYYARVEGTADSAEAFKRKVLGWSQKKIVGGDTVRTSELIYDTYGVREVRNAQQDC